MSIEDIASVHLGKAGDGSVVKPYITPDTVDKSLLVPIPRCLNRIAYDIGDNNLPFFGFDTWHAYEVSFLLNNGYPINCVAKITYDAGTTCIVESKSLKLYLNSFNMHRMGNSDFDAITAARQMIADDLSEVLNTNVEVFLHDVLNRNAKLGNGDSRYPIAGYFPPLEDYFECDELEFDDYNENIDILQIDPKNSNQGFSVWTPALRSNCRVTNQPDWGDVFIYMKGPDLPTPDSLMKYIVSMRKENHFHEEVCECIYKRLLDKFSPVELFVGCLYTRRGGIDINPVRASHLHLLNKATVLRNTTILTDKTARQ